MTRAWKFAIGNLDRKLPWGPRRAELAKAYGDLEADVICLTESSEYEKTLMVDMPGAFFQVSDHVNCPILVRANVFTRAKQGISISVQGYGRKRYGTAVQLQDIETNFKFCMTVWHPSNTGEYPSGAQANTGRIAQAESLIKILDKYAGRDLPIVVLGDYNDRNWTGGIPGVMLRERYRDMLKDANMGVRIDRGFSRGFTTLSGKWVPISKRLTDHGGVTVFDVVPSGVVPDPDPTPEPEPAPNTINIGGKTYSDPGDISVLRLNQAWVDGKFSVEGAVLQTWLERLGFYKSPVDGFIGPVTRQAVYEARKKFFPTWPESDLVSDLTGGKTLERIRTEAGSPRKIKK